jgi:DNA-binding transcriptional ArsR family regulator
MNLLFALFPRVRAEVLRLLFADASIELHFRELVRRSGLTVGTLQTELSKLSTTGLLRSERDGNRLYYRANPDHPAFIHLQAVVHCAFGHLIEMKTPADSPEVAKLPGAGRQIDEIKTNAAQPRVRKKPAPRTTSGAKVLFIGDLGMG